MDKKVSNGWSKYELFVVRKLERLEVMQEKQGRDIDTLRVGQEVMRSKSSARSVIENALGAAIPASILIAYMLLA